MAQPGCSISTTQRWVNKLVYGNVECWNAWHSWLSGVSPGESRLQIPLGGRSLMEYWIKTPFWPILPFFFFFFNYSILIFSFLGLLSSSFSRFSSILSHGCIFLLCNPFSFSNLYLLCLPVFEVNHYVFVHLCVYHPSTLVSKWGFIMRVLCVRHSVTQTRYG